jgi:hypothetical protein
MRRLLVPLASLALVGALLVEVLPLLVWQRRAGGA